MPNWSGSNRRSELPSDWDKIRKRVLRRDSSLCQWIQIDDNYCLKEATEVDHIQDPYDHSLENLQSLCSWHHSQKTAKESSEARSRNRAKNHNKFKRQDKHPGLS